MITKFTRFSIILKQCDCCKRYIWLEKYRCSNVWHARADRYWKENICKKCVDLYLPYIRQNKKDSQYERCEKPEELN